MRRRDINQARFFAQVANYDSVFVDPRRPKPRAITGEDAVRAVISGILDRHLVAGFEQQPHAQIDALRRAVYDDHLAGVQRTARDRDT